MSSYPNAMLQSKR